ncbi:MAG: TIGR01244 family sulfur transferase [Paracoccaceae bacterium]
MNIQQISEDFSITSQVHPEHMKALAENGIRAIICNRPDGEEFGQPSFDIVQTAAKAAGIQMRYVPIVHGAAGLAEFTAFGEALKTLPAPILGYCRSGMRSASMYSAVTEKTG